MKLRLPELPSTIREDLKTVVNYFAGRNDVKRVILFGRTSMGGFGRNWMPAFPGDWI